MTRDDAEQVIDRIMGEYGFSMPSRAYAELVDEFMCAPAAPGIDPHALGLLEVLGAKDFAEASNIVGGLLADASHKTTAAPGIDLHPIRYAIKYAAAAARENTHSELAEDFDELIRKLDASHNGGMNEQFGSAE